MFREICLLILIYALRNAYCAIQCLDQNNNPVDWYVVFKHPKLEDDGGERVSNGAAYMYMTSETLDQGWTWSSIGIQNPETILANTLKPYYDNPDKGLWILYNDEDPKLEGLDESFYVDYGGHTKGVVGADSTGGFWLVHSIPKYPPNSNAGYSYPHSGLMYGQSALCVTLTPQSLNTVGKALMYNDPDIYDHVLESKLLRLYPELVAAAKKTNHTQAPWYFKGEITTAGKASFVAFAKGPLFGKDLYELVAGQVKAELLAETWQNEKDPLPSTCHTQYQVLNIKGIHIKDREVSYKSSKDHSKWAIGSKEYWTCIGDINRAGPQEKRGGGTVCIHNQSLWERYHEVIGRIEDCNSRYKPWPYYYRHGSPF